MAIGRTIYDYDKFNKIVSRYIEVFESRASEMDRVQKSGNCAFRKNASQDRDRKLRGERGFGSVRDIDHREGKGISNYCVRLRGLPWETTKVYIYKNK